MENSSRRKNKQILDCLIKRFQEDYDMIIEHGNISYIGLSIGVAVGKYIMESDQERFYDEIAFYDGIRAGIDISRDHQKNHR